MKRYHGTREAFSAAMQDLAREDDRIMFVSPDSLKAMRAVDFAEQYPAAYIETGIAEQCAVAAAAGMASCGMIPFVGSYAGFLTMRACEQVRTFVAYPNLNVKLVGINAGLIGGEREGVTHQFYEDLGILSSIPNVIIFTPADAAQTYHACIEAAKIDGPVYIRAGSGREPDVFTEEMPFSPDGFTAMKEGSGTVLLLSSGYVLNRVLAAAQELSDLGVRVADVNILHGKHPEKLVELLRTSDRIVTVEDHNVHGGLGSYIAGLCCAYHPALVKRIGLHTFGESGPADALADLYGFSVEALSKTVRAFAAQ